MQAQQDGGPAGGEQAAGEGGEAPVQASGSGEQAALVMAHWADEGVVQRKGGGPAQVHRAAAEGVQGAGSPLSHFEQIQRSFGRHDMSGVRAHVGGAAEKASKQMGADAYATGHHVAFKQSPDLHTAAHEAAHVVQQRGGVQLKDGVGSPGDSYERNADEVADRVVQGRSAEDLLDPVASHGKASGGAVQHRLPKKEVSGKAMTRIGHAR